MLIRRKRLTSAYVAAVEWKHGYHSALQSISLILKGRSWIVKRSYEDFRVLDKHLHLCIYDRRFSQLPELPRLDSLTDQSEVSTENSYTRMYFYLQTEEL